MVRETQEEVIEEVLYTEVDVGVSKKNISEQKEGKQKEDITTADVAPVTIEETNVDATTTLNDATSAAGYLNVGESGNEEAEEQFDGFNDSEATPAPAQSAFLAFKASQEGSSSEDETVTGFGD